MRAAGVGLLSGMVATRASLSSVSISAGTYRYNNATYSFAGQTLTNILSTAAGTHRYDVIVFDCNTSTLKRLLGSELAPQPNPSGFLDNRIPAPPELENESQILIAIVKVTSSGIPAEVNGKYSTNGVANLAFYLPSPFTDSHNDERYSLLGHLHDAAYAAIGHLHDAAYAAIGHLHTGVYSPAGHDHNSVYSLLGHVHDSLYSAANHLHDSRYSLLGHLHDAVYAPISKGVDGGNSHNALHDAYYAAIGHLHDARYSLLGHLHDSDYPRHSLATAANDFLVASGSGAFVKKTLAEVKTILGLGSAAFTESWAYLSYATKLDDLYSPDDNTDLDASTSKHGLMPKFPGTKQVLLGDKTWLTRVFGPGSFVFGDGSAVILAQEEGIGPFPLACKITEVKIREQALISSTATITLHVHDYNGAIGDAVDSFSLNGASYSETGLNWSVAAGKFVTIKVASPASAKQLSVGLVFEAE